MASTLIAHVEATAGLKVNAKATVTLWALILVWIDVFNVKH